MTARPYADWREVARGLLWPVIAVMLVIYVVYLAALFVRSDGRVPFEQRCSLAGGSTVHVSPPPTSMCLDKRGIILFQEMRS